MRYPEEPVYSSSGAVTAMIQLMMPPAGALVRAFTMRIDQQYQSLEEREVLYALLTKVAAEYGYSLHVIRVPKYRELKDKPPQYMYNLVWLLKESAT